MGSKRVLKCSQCGYEFQFSEGQGFFDYCESGRRKSKELILSGVLGKELKQALEKFPHLTIYRSSVLFYCRECSRYESGSIYKLFESETDFTSKALIVSKHICRRCKKEMEYIENVCRKNVSCPRCQSTMRSYVVGCWD